MVEEPKQEENQDKYEVQKIALDYFKHMTTISGAAALALVAIYKEELLDKELLLAALAVFGISAFSSFIGITSTLSPSQQRLCHPFLT